MLISKKSRRRSEMFESRFRGSEGVDFPLRQFMRCKEEFSGGLVHVLLLAAFAFVLGSFGRTLNNLFVSHGDSVNPAYRWMALGLLVLFILVVLRRILYKVMELRDLRHEMEVLKDQMSEASE